MRTSTRSGPPLDHGTRPHLHFRAAPPPPKDINALLVDLCRAINDDTLPTLVQAALARQLFAALAHAGWSCALATGGWERSARLKLTGAGLEADALVMASSNDASTRIEIMQIAAVRAQGHGADFTRIVSIGDAVWDIHAAAALQWPFIGVAEGTAVTTLRNNGATTIVADYSDFSAFLAALDSAAPPRLARRA